MVGVGIVPSMFQNLDVAGQVDMNRRNFLKSMGAATAVSALPLSVVAKLAGDTVPVNESVSFESDNASYTIGYDYLQNYTWLRVTYFLPDGGEWHDLVRQSGNHLESPEIMYKTAEQCHQRFLADRGMI